MNQPTTTIFLLQLGALWILFAFLIKDYALDRMRENLFVIRDQLFDRVAKTDRAFGEKNYLHLRSYINKAIRRGHVITPSRSFLYDFLNSVPGVTGGVSASEMRAQATEQIKWLADMEKNDDRAKEIHAAVHMQLIQYYCLTSPIFLMLMFVAIVFVICSVGALGVRAVVQLAFGRFFGANIDRGIATDGDLLATGAC